MPVFVLEAMLFVRLRRLWGTVCRRLPFLFLLALSAAGHAAEPAQVLVLHSYSQEYPWTLRQHRGFMDALRADPARAYDVRVEYLDTKRAGYTAGYAAMLAEHLSRKYQGYRPAAVYVTDDNALSFARAHADALFPGVPVFFSGVNDYSLRSRLDPARITGVFEMKEIAANLALMQAMAPDNRDIVVVGDATETYRAIETEIAAALGRQRGVSASFVSSASIDGLVAGLAAQKARFVFLTTLGGVSDRSGRTLTLPETIEAIVKAGDFVVFSMEDAYLYPGVLGGYVTSGARQGAAAAGLLRRHLDGTPLPALAPIEASPNEYVIDDAELARSGLALPPAIAAQATRLNVRPSFYAANRGLVLGSLYTLAGVVIAGLLGAVLVVARKNRRILAAAALQAELQDGLARAQRIAHLGNWDWHIPENRLHWSDGIYRVFGIAPRAFGASYQAFLQAVHPDDRDAVAAAVRRALDDGAPYEIEHRIVRPDGTLRTVHESAEVLRDAGGRPVRMIGTVQDITERKAAEQALRDSETRANQIIENAPEAMLVVDAHGRIRRVNGGAEAMFGYARGALVGEAIEVLVPEAMRARHGQDREAYLRHARPRAMGRSRDLLARRRNGSLFPVEVRLAPMPSDGGMHVIASIVDVSEHRAMQEEIARHRERLEELVAARTAELVAARNEAERLARAKSEFLANMSHEIRTPLNAVLGFARIGARESGAGGEHFQRILDAGVHLLGVVNDILDISRIEAGKLQVESRPFRLSTVLANARSFVAGAAQHKGLDCVVATAPDLPDWVGGDAQRLQQVLVNLLANAVKFTERGEVRLEVARDGAEIRFDVVDTGIGITPEQLARLFVPFEQADSSTTRRFGGSGLGLAISQRLAQMMGGRIAVRSVPGAGSRFTLHLLLPAADATARGDAADAAAAGPRLRGLRVLAAEDMEVNRVILEEMLRHEGARVAFAEHGAEAIARLQADGAGAFDVVLMDVQMPVMDGIEATRELRRLAPDLPVIGLTAHTLDEERERCRAAGMVRHVTKPVDADELVAGILGAVGRREEADAAAGA